MNSEIRILGISGSLRQQSYNTAVLRAAVGLAPEGVAIETFELDGIPPFNQDEESSPPAKVLELKRSVRAADGILFVTPEYNYSVPGVLKNAIDWASRPYGDNVWDRKPAAIMGASIGAIGTARAQYHLRQMFVFLNVFPVNQPEVMIGNAAQRFDTAGKLADETTKDYMRQLLENLVELIRYVRQPPISAPISDSHTLFATSNT
jgi:chromate reductase